MFKCFFDILEVTGVVKCGLTTMKFRPGSRNSETRTSFQKVSYNIDVDLYIKQYNAIIYTLIMINSDYITYSYSVLQYPGPMNSICNN